MNRRAEIRTAVKAIITVIAVQVAGGLLFLTSGAYNIAADEPHLAPVRWMLYAGRTRAVEFRSRGVQVPNLGDPALLKRGFRLFRENCQPCHGAPGVANEQMGRGIDPKPPPLGMAANKWTDPELFWITTHGLKLSGMPGFAPRLSESDLWGIVAFLRRDVFLSPADYKQLSAAADAGIDDPLLEWPTNEDYGFGQLKREGNARAGRELVRTYGCTACHTISGGSESNVGPPLAGFAERQYVAGVLVNVPSNSVAWIVNPQQFKPKTAMPNLGVKPAEALDMTAYLYTSGSSARLTALERNLGARKASK